MSDAITPGAKVGSFEVLSVDPTGKRLCVGCRCGGVHIVGAEAWRSGSVLCSAVPLTAEQVDALRSETEHQQRRRERDWRPQR